jgi:vanillate O-demethylase ferredoxin subunit
MDAWLDLRVKSREQLTANVVKLELVAPKSSELPIFKAGSYIDIQIPGGMLRPYSLCNGPQDKVRYVIAVRREIHSKGASAYLHDTVKAGDMLRVRHPLNEFSLDSAAPYSVLLGGGVGIAPLLSMAEDLWHRGAAFEVHLSARNQLNAPFGEQLLQSPFKSRVQFHWSELQDGRLSFERCFKRLSSLSHIYLCGPAPYMTGAISTALKCGVSQERIHSENFG